MQTRSTLLILVLISLFGTACLSIAYGQDDTNTAPKAEEPAISYYCDPVEGEPDLPLTDEEAGKRRFATLPRSGYTFEVELPGTGEKVKGVAVYGHVILNQGPIELFGCVEGGKEHETVVRFLCDISELDLAFIMSDFRSGTVPEKLGDESTPQGTRVLAFVRWQAGEKTVTYPAEDLVVDVRRNARMPRVGWTYVGEWMEVPDPSKPEGGTQKILGATASRSLLTTWRASWTILDNPLPDSIDDHAYVANHDVLPMSGTPVLVYFRQPTKQEREKITGLERAYK